MARGDHIKVSRGLYSHHGIDVGNGEVIHYSGELPDLSEKKNAVVCRVSKTVFADGGKVLIVIHEEGNCFPPEETVRRAELHLGGGLRKYGIGLNNCEHFARWCKTGTKTSRQVEGAAAGLAVGNAARVAARAGGPWGWVIGGAIFLASLLLDKDKTKPDDDTPKIEG